MSWLLQQCSGLSHGGHRGFQGCVSWLLQVLDAPALQDDFYLNLVDWSAQNVLAVGLGTCVYLWSACTSKVTKLCDFSSSEPQDSVCSVSWSQRGTYLSVGTNNGETQLWDVAKIKMIRTMQVGHHEGYTTLHRRDSCCGV